MRNAQMTTEFRDIEDNFDKAIISFEKQKIEIPLNFELKKDRLMYRMFCDLQERVSSLEKDLKRQEMLANAHIERNISDEMAKKEIIAYLKDKRTKGIQKVSIIDIVSDLILPADQIDKIMEQLEGENI